MILDELVAKDLFLVNDLTTAELRSKIAFLEEVLKTQEQLEIKTTHYFSKGVYAREIFVPRGTILIGKIHKHENLNILSSGEISVLSIDGAQRMKAPCTIISSPGVKRVAYVHEDTVWTTIHGTDETDLSKIEQEFIAADYSEVAGISSEEIKLIEGVKDVLGSGWRRRNDGGIGSGECSKSEETAATSE